jgi:putative endonuclease
MPYRNFLPCVYIMASERNGTLYVGSSSDLVKRAWQHKNEYFEGFSKEYNTKLLVYYEVHDTMENACTRERQIKEWQRNWKKDLIEKDNPEWRDLYDDII